jgi:hypothetical protein
MAFRLHCKEACLILLMLCSLTVRPWTMYEIRHIVLHVYCIKVNVKLSVWAPWCISFPSLWFWFLLSPVGILSFLLSFLVCRFLPAQCRCGGLLLHAITQTQTHTTLGWTLLVEGSARRRDLYLTAHNIHERQMSMPLAGLEPAIPTRMAADLRLRSRGHWDRPVGSHW